MSLCLILFIFISEMSKTFLILPGFEMYFNAALWMNPALELSLDTLQTTYPIIKYLIIENSPIPIDKEAGIIINLILGIFDNEKYSNVFLPNK